MKRCDGARQAGGPPGPNSFGVSTPVLPTPVDVLVGFPLQKKSIFFRQLATMVDAALPLSSALATAGKQVAPKLAREMADQVDAGERLSAVMARYPHFFSDYEISMVSTGEISGNLDGQLGALADGVEKSWRLQQEVSSKLVYPVLVLHAAVFIPPLYVLVTQSPAAYLKLTLGLLIPAYLVTFLVWAIYRFSGQSQGMRKFMDSALAMTPILGAPFKTLGLARFCNSMSYLAESGFNPDQAVQIAAGSCGSAYVGDRILAAQERLGKGSRLSQVLTASGVFNPLFVSMVATGEESGQLSRLLAKAGEHLDTELKTQTHRIMTVLPILLLLGVGVVVGSIVIKFYASFQSQLPF